MPRGDVTLFTATVKNVFEKSYSCKLEVEKLRRAKQNTAARGINVTYQHDAYELLLLADSCHISVHNIVIYVCIHDI